MDAFVLNIGGKDSVNLACPKCGRSRTVPVPDLKRQTYKIRCACGHEFAIKLNKRRHVRKNTNLIGAYSVAGSVADYAMSVLDISRSGLCFTRSDCLRLEPGRNVSLRFRLDTSNMDIIVCDGVIRSVEGDRVSIEFLELGGSQQRDIGFYIL
jgi:hypothetical protein